MLPAFILRGGAGFFYLPPVRFSPKPLVYIAALAAAYYITYVDALTGHYAETYWTELPQELMLLAMVVLHVVVGRRYAFGRAFNYALAGFALTCLIREHNNQLADLIHRRAWFVLAAPVGLATALYAWRQRRAIYATYAQVRDTFGFGVLMIGFLILHLFSRLFGANDLWYATMGDDYMRVVARTNEEGIELMAYTVLLLGTVEVVSTIGRLARERPELNAEATELLAAPSWR